MKEYKFTINGNLYKVDVLDTEGNLTKIEVNGTAYNVELIREPPKLKPVQIPTARIKTGDAGSSSQAGKDGPVVQVRAPLPGIIVQVLVKPGDEVTKGQSLFTLETMKMENAIKAENPGTVASVKITPGQTVNQDEVMVELR
ncbi:MAG: biotin/lipoyl-containing protein [Bacteroidales bacterium]|jgi:biotin carboxyl carrier protein